MIRKLVIIACAMSASPVCAHDGVTVDELTFGRSLNGIIEGYRICGFPLTALGDIPARFNNFANSHYQYGESMAKDYAKRNAASRAMFAAMPAVKNSECAKARSLQEKSIATARRSVRELDEAHARAEAAKR
ncbi:hypothetical protein ACVOMT_05925 [Sphingomonas panni]